MSLSKLDDMFTESHFDEYAGESRAASPLGDLDFGIGKLSVSPVPYESTCSKADDSSGIMVTSDVSATGGLLSVFDSEQQFLRNDIAKFTTEIDNIASVSEANLHGQRPDEGQGSGAHDSSDSARMHGPSIYGDAAAQVDEIDRTQKLNGCLIVYASSRRNSSRSIDTKLNQNNYTKDSSRKFMIAQNDSLSDLKSLQISRRKRSLHSKTAKSSVWGLERLPAFEENNEHDPCLSNRKEVGRVSVGHGEEKVIRDQTGQKPVQKSSTPTGRISLKIKIGNQSFGVVDVDKKSIVSQKKNSALCDIKESKFHPGKMLSPYESNLEDVMTSDASALGTHLDVTDSMENKSLRASTENRCSDPGTSPDSEVINSVRDAPLHNRGSQDMQDSPVAGVSFMGVSSLSLPKLQSKKGKKTTGAKTKNKDKASLVPGLKQKAMDISNCDDASIVPLGNPFQNACSRERVSRGTVDGSWMTNSEIPCSTTKSLGACSNGQKFLKCSRAKGGCTGKTGILNLPRKKGKSSRKKGDKSNLIFKHQIDVKDDATGFRSKVENLLEAGNQTSRDLGEVGDLSTNSAGPGFVSSSGWTNCQYVPPSNAWVLCDECQKWRRIPATLADQIDQTNSQWTCKDNTDKDFADCSIPQEKSNSEINEELDISDASCDEDADDTYLKSNKNKSTAAKQSSWTLIKSNIFLHRRRKTQSIDEVMVCHCKPPSDGKMGCGAECLNQMLNIECVEGTCPCGELCSNQQFQKRMYAKLKWLRCGKKGFGLQALQDISEGQFLIEYVGEVLDIHAHEARQREYALQGHKHFYFMTLNGSEVIDACAKGNLGRFINHSCDPNCQTEKWMVNGEVCVGLFAIRDIKKGEEVTFDYNYVRVLGAAAKKCVCGSPNCRGYIGGDAKNFEVIVQEDSDDEYAEPVMICEDREMKNDWTDIMTQSMFEKEIEYRYDLDKDRYRMKNVNAAVQSESATSDTSIEKAVVSSTSSECSRAATATQSDSFALATSKAESESLLSKMSSPVNLMEASLRSEEIINSTIPGKLQPEAVSKKKLKYGNMGGKDESPKSNSLAKTHYSSLSIKSNFMNDKANGDCDKQTAVRPKSKILSSLPRNSHVEAVEGKLNELLDTEGGISKRKDASRGYLKLLFLTAASGTNGHGEAIQSNRALSMILDALLKTKSRTVLVDIINKNGLQMLHNIMKRYRKEFIKTPILRKLLKVLEYLAVRGILTLEHIAGSSSRPGVESFKDSILTLTEHADKQVHQIARNFRDKWIPKSLRKSCFMELGDGKMEFRQHSSYSKLSVSSGNQWSDRGGKHPDSVEPCDKSPVVAPGVETSTLDHSSVSGCSFGTNGRTRKRKSRWDNPTEESMYPKKPNIDNDIPPGFLSPIHMAPATACSTALSFHETGIFSKHPSDILLADSQERFAACLPVSYGIPSSVVQQFGVLNAEAAPVWTVAPGLPFRPFPPLPPCASDKGEQPTLVAKCVVEPVERMGQDRDACYSGNERTTSSSLDPPMASEHPEEGSYNLGRKYFRQQKWNHSKLAPPWLRMKNGWGHSASTRNSLRRGLDFGNGTN